MWDLLFLFTLIPLRDRDRIVITFFPIFSWPSLWDSGKIKSLKLQVDTWVMQMQMGPNHRTLYHKNTSARKWLCSHQRFNGGQIGSLHLGLIHMLKELKNERR